MENSLRQRNKPINDRSCKESELSISISLPLLPESHKPVGRARWPPVVWAPSLEGRWSCRSAHCGWGHCWWSLMLLLLPRWQFHIWAPEVWGKLSSLCSALSNSLRPNGLKPTRLLYPQVFFFRQEYWSGLPFLSPSLSLYQSYKLYPLALDQNSLHFEFLTRNPWKRSEE